MIPKTNDSEELILFMNGSKTQVTGANQSKILFCKIISLNMYNKLEIESNACVFGTESNWEICIF